MLRNKHSIMSCVIRVWLVPVLFYLIVMYVGDVQPAAVPSAGPVHDIDQSGENEERQRKYHYWW